MSLIEKEKSLSEILSLIAEHEDAIVSMGNGEPDYILSAIDENPDVFNSLKIHQLLEIKDRKYINGEFPNIRYISYFLSQYSRKAFLKGQCDLVPNHFHQVPKLLEEVTNQPIVLCQASPIDENGYFSLGTEAEYTAYFIGKAPFILQVNEHMPRTNGVNKIHVNDVAGFIQHNQPLFELKETPIKDIDMKIAEYVAERIDDGSTLQVGIGGVPNAVISLLKNHRNLGIHTEMLTEGCYELFERGVITGNQKKTYQEKMVATFALGSQRLYNFMNENKHIEMLTVDQVNDPNNIGKEDKMVIINASTEIDFYGQCASETVAGKYYSSTGGQADFGAGVRLAKNGKGFICLYSTTKNDTVSKIKPTLTPGSVVTTSKNDVDYVVTEYGIAQLKGKSIRERTLSLINIAHPKFRDELTFEAKKMGFLI
ncbi:acetyl-CoA hydrolase/transferase family protein [Bacillaceae bacterium W0354]